MVVMFYFNTLLLFNFIYLTFTFEWQKLDLPAEHIPLFFASNPKLLETCLRDETCLFKDTLQQTAKCWSYYDNCHYSQLQSYSSPQCNGDSKGWVSNKSAQLDMFFSQADFGFIKEQREELKQYCEPQNNEVSQSSLTCSDHLKHCRGQNIFLDLRSLATRTTPVRYHMDVLKSGDIGGHCRVNKSLLSSNADQISPLQTWAPELRHFVSTTVRVNEWQCDVWFDKPVIIMKIDAAVSLYHHFCDFFNLYMSQHINNTHQYTFSTDVKILIWETYPYRSSFSDAWRAFTKHPLMNLADVAGKRLCFREVLFPLLPRMIFGLYYNTPIIWGCEKSGLFKAFNRHFMHRLRIPIRDAVQDKGLKAPPGDGLVHVTLLARRTEHRRIINERALIRAIQARDDILFTLADFSHGTSFTSQLRTIASTDVLVGMHGAGLTHSLFLPDWAVLFELYNCGDENCYKDLARLRGVSYFTWTDMNKIKAQDEGHHPEVGAHEKFTNYQFDVVEFMRILDECIKTVQRNKQWRKYNKQFLTSKDEL